MRVGEVRAQEQLEQLQPVWNRLLNSSASGTTFLTWEWVTAWWAAYGSANDLRILTAVDHDGTIRGIAPLRRERIRRYGQTFVALNFIGDNSNDSDYLDFIVQRGFEEAVINAWLAHLQPEFKAGMLLRLNEVPAHSPSLHVLRGLAPTPLLDERPVACATVSLPSGWDEYLTRLKPRFRTKVRSVLRSLESRSEVSFGFCEDPSQVDRLLAALFDLHTRRWNQDGRPGVFGWDRKRHFYSDLSRRLLDRGSLRFSWLEWNGRVLACQYGFVHGNTYLHLQEGYEPTSEHWNVGVGLRAWTIREFIRTGIGEYDFLAGVGRHKTDWGATTKESIQAVVAIRTARSVLFCRGPEWQQRARAFVRTAVPERLLAARRAHLTRKSVAAPTASTSDPIRRAAARCYFRLGGPAVARFVRTRYQATVAPDGRLVRGSWTRRREPVGRILYYHRVNDDNDLFFPATPIDVFEQQMRHIAGCYRIVSLAGLVSHLDSGSPESVVAVTFDDGYRDNYDNAFPILQRYGVPATIFLTTGSLDSREPLWFEVLADAFKTTVREFLDLEIDLPRRFWLRTNEERLSANGELFALLRNSPDSDRQRLLSCLLEQLAAPANGRRKDMMLTWDQVRLMKSRGVDFGGHTVTHPYLSRLTHEQVAWEVSECKSRIEEEVQAPVAHFAYPNGREEDFSPWNKEIIRAAGYQAAVTTVWGQNFRSTDRLELRRGGAWELDEAVFACKMDWYQLVNG